MATNRKRLVVGMVAAVLVLGVAGTGVALFPPAAPQGYLLAEQTMGFSEEASLAWAEDATGQASVVKVSSLSAKAASLGGQTMYGWNNGVHNAFSGDFNGDGRWDIGVTGTASQGDRCWYVRYGDGKGGFGNETRYCWGNGVTNVFTGDFNGDGKWDIGVTGTAEQKERIWYIRYGDGKGGFGNQTQYTWNNGVTNVFTGDFNGDGKWDIGVTGTEAQRERTWYIRYGDGKGNFGNQTQYTWNNGVTNVFTGDFNGDGKWDIGVTGTATQRDRTWYIRYGDGKGGFGSEDTYAWGNGAANIFTGDFNGDKLWDLGVTGDQAKKDAYWYIRYNQMKPSAPTPAPSNPAPVNDAAAQKGGQFADLAYSKLLGRAPTQAERQSMIDRWRAGENPDQLWATVARSQERITKYGYYAPAFGPSNNKTEQCFGAIGSKCEGAPFTPTVTWLNKFTRPDGVEMGYVRIAVAVGSILHDNICLDNSAGAWCNGTLTAITGELPLIRQFGPASMEWNKAVYNVRDGRYWLATFGPYPTDAGRMATWSDDLTQVAARRSLMAKILPVGAAPTVTEPYQGKETRQTKILKAPAGTYVDREDQQFCASGSYVEEGRWWTAQWWGKCK